MIVKRLFLFKSTPSFTLTLAFSAQGILACYLEDKAMQGCYFDQMDAQPLKQWVDQKNFMKKKCLCLLSPQHYQTILFEKPTVPHTELLGAIRWKVADFLDFPLENAKIDYIEIPSKRSNESSMIYVVVANTAHIQTILDLTKNADLKVTVIDIPELALLNVFESLPSPNKTRVFIGFQENDTQLIIFKNKKLLFMRRLDLVFQKSKNFEKILNEVALQVQRSLDYCSSNIMDVSSANIYLDLSDRDPLLPEKLSAILGLRVLYFDIKELLNIDYSENIPQNYLSLASLGGILRANIL